jgi:hypothetical protein
MRTSATAIAVIAWVLVAAGCASSGTRESTTSVVSPVVVEPAGSTTTSRPVVLPISPKGMRGLDPPEGARFLSSTRLAIAGVVGSSNCPSVPKKLIVESPHKIRIDLSVGSWGRTVSGRRVQVPRRPRICLADLHPVPVVIAIDPARIDVYHPVNVSLYYPGLAVRRNKRPVVVTVPPLASRQVRQEVQIARATNPRLFSIFPTVPGTERCAIRDGAIGTKAIPGTCRTSIRARPTMEPSWTVTFTERWLAPPCLAGYCPPPSRWRHHTWQVGEGETVVTAGSKPRVYGTRSRGATPPQYYK